MKNLKKSYEFPTGLFMHDIETAWLALDRSENERQLALTAELLRWEQFMWQKFFSNPTHSPQRNILRKSFCDA